VILSIPYSREGGERDGGKREVNLPVWVWIIVIGGAVGI